MSSFNDYFGAIGATNALRERVTQIIELYAAVGTSGIETVFVSEYVDDSGERVYESVWLFASDFVMEARLGADSEELDQVRLHRNLERWQITRRDYDFRTPRENSRLTVAVSWSGDVSGTLKASGENCEWLRRIVAERLSPNLV